MNKMDIYNIFHKIRPEILFDLHQEIDRPVKNEHLQQKRLFPIVNFPFISGNIPASPACEGYIS